jgi:hypothetical protein
VELGTGPGLSGLDEVFTALRDSAGRVAPEESIRQAATAVRRAEARAGEFFPEPLPPPCEVTPMPEVVAVSGAAPHYTPPRLDGGRPGTFWFNTRRPTAGTGWDTEVVAFHEAVPGHHLQLSRLQLLTSLPALQRQRSIAVFSEGWGLYAEQLAEEAGLYADDRGLLGSISTSLMRAARLVVDTGIHAFGWSRERALGFMAEHVPMPQEFLASEVGPVIVMPGRPWPTSPASSRSSGSATMPASVWARRSRACLPRAVLDHGRSRCRPWLAASPAGWIARADPVGAGGRPGGASSQHPLAYGVLPNDWRYEPSSCPAPRSRGVTKAVSRAWPGARPGQVPANSKTAIAAVGNFDLIRSRSLGREPPGPDPAAAPGAAASSRARSSIAGLCPMSSSVPSRVDLTDQGQQIRGIGLIDPGVG